MPESLGNLTPRREGQFYKLKVIPSKVKLKEKNSQMYQNYNTEYTGY